MKNLKIQILAALAVVGLIATPLISLAATLSLSPATVTVTEGEEVTMTITLDPQGTTIYSTKVELDYPSELLEFSSFIFGPGWTHASADDHTDNTNGLLRRTAGYPNPGFSSTGTFGTVSFIAKGNGTGEISVTAESASYDSSLQNVLTGVPTLASVTVSSAVSAPTEEEETEQEVTTSVSGNLPEVPEEENVETGEDELATTTSTTTDGESQGTSLLAAVGQILTLGTDRLWVGILLALAILAGILYGTGLFPRRGR